MLDESRSQRPARMVAEFGHDLSFDAIPSEVVEAAKDHMLDALGVGLAAASLPEAGRLTASVAHLGAGGQSTAFGLATPLPAASALFMPTDRRPGIGPRIPSGPAVNMIRI